MPQMAPLMWLTLLFLFISIFMMFNMINYFNFMPNSLKNMKTESITKKTNLLNWKW